MKNKVDYDLILDILFKVGLMMIESGAETTRSEDTMGRIAKKAGVKDFGFYTTPTEIIIGINDVKETVIKRIDSRSINLERVDRINELSRCFTANKIDINELSDKINELERFTPDFPIYLKCLGAFVVSGTMMAIFSPTIVSLLDVPISGFLGMLGYMISYFLHRDSRLQFISDFAASFVVGILSAMLFKLDIVASMSGVIIGGVMPLVPGTLIINGLQDMLSGHLLSGTLRLLEAMLVAVFIGAGIALVFRFLL